MRSNSLFRFLKPPRGFKLTKPGKIFFALLLCLVFIAMATGNNLLFLILAAMLAFMIVSGIESELNLRYLELERVLPAEIYAGLATRIGYLVRNRKTRSSRLILKDLGQVRIGELFAQETELAQGEFIFPKRGQVHLGRITIATTYPYGLFEKSISFPLEKDILVFPEPLTFTPSFSAGARDSGGGRAKESISHVRPYTVGDTLSSIVWKRQHKHGLISKIYEGGSGMGGIVVLTPGPEMEKKLSRATYYLSVLQRTGRPFGLVLNDIFSGMSSSRDHKIRLLEQLALVDEIHQSGQTELPPDAEVIFI